MEMKKVYTAINAVTSALIFEGGIGKTRKNEQQNYKFRGIDEVLNSLAPLLVKYKLVILPRVLSRSQVERQSANGKPIFYTQVDVEFRFISSEDGSVEIVQTCGEAMDSADKSTNKAMSAAYKYAAIMAFAIPTEGDNDADATTHDVNGKAEPKQEDKKALPETKNFAWLNQMKAEKKRVGDAAYYTTMAKHTGMESAKHVVKKEAQDLVLAELKKLPAATKEGAANG